MPAIFGVGARFRCCQLASCPDLRACLFVAIRTFNRRCLAIAVLCLMAINTQSGSCAGVVERRLQLDGDRRRCRVGMAIGASLLRSLKWLLLLGGVMANFAFAGHLQVRWVIELHRAHGAPSGRLELLALSARTHCHILEEGQVIQIGLQVAWRLSRSLQDGGAAGKGPVAAHSDTLHSREIPPSLL